MSASDVPSDADERLALRLRALAHPARLAILRALARMDRCQCGEIVRGLTLAQSTVSQHLKVLKEAGLITGTIEGPRSCYCLDRDTVATLQGELVPLFALLAVPPVAAGGDGGASNPDTRDAPLAAAGRELI